MTPSAVQTNFAASQNADNSRLEYLDATRAFALVLGIVFHACLSFMPVFMGWAVQDISTSPLVAMFMTVSHSFRMEAFFLLAGFFSHLTFHRSGEFVRSRVLRIVVPFVVGWFILRPLVVSGWIMGSASLRGDSRCLGRPSGRLPNPLDASRRHLRGIASVVRYTPGDDHRFGRSCGDW
jgi:hypothetical protein